ncbi:MAG TPA: hypothetical protein VFQ61_15575, partial [Polyangiaceae bacterium]|nr:hypothetical protein [Polyangiaceae bacterium]
MPFQDLAQHAAAVRVLSDFDLPRLGFSEFFEPAYGASQYLSVYALARLLTPAFGAVVAIKLVLASALVSTPYALRALLRALDKPAILALLCLPLTFNAHVVLGFVHFVAGVPCMLFGLALGARSCRAPSIGTKLGLAAVGVLCFYTHVVPYAMLCVGTILLGASRSPARTVERSLPLGASALCALWWLRVSPSGATLRQLGRGWVSAARNEDRSVLRSLEELPVWLSDVFGARFDDLSLAVWASLMIIVLLSGWSRV